MIKLAQPPDKYFRARGFTAGFFLGNTTNYERSYFIVQFIMRQVAGFYFSKIIIYFNYAR